jgi:hypothetical protein
MTSRYLWLWGSAKTSLCPISVRSDGDQRDRPGKTHVCDRDEDKARPASKESRRTHLAIRASPASLVPATNYRRYSAARGASLITVNVAGRERDGNYVVGHHRVEGTIREGRDSLWSVPRRGGRAVDRGSLESCWAGNPRPEGSNPSPSVICSIHESWPTRPGFVLGLGARLSRPDPVSSVRLGQ